jgi:hypothetical protein
MSDQSPENDAISATPSGGQGDRKSVPMRIATSTTWTNPAWQAEPDPPVWLAVPAMVLLTVLAVALLAVQIGAAHV